MRYIRVVQQLLVPLLARQIDLNDQALGRILLHKDDNLLACVINQDVCFLQPDFLDLYTEVLVRYFVNVREYGLVLLLTAALDVLVLVEEGLELVEPLEAEAVEDVEPHPSLPRHELNIPAPVLLLRIGVERDVHQLNLEMRLVALPGGLEEDVVLLVRVVYQVQDHDSLRDVLQGLKLIDV